MAMFGAGNVAADTSMDTVPGESGGPPELVVESKVYAFGEIWNGETLRHAFVLHNKGDSDLRIERIEPG
jgi:hypothetical protein